MENGIDSGLEIRRLLMLTRLKGASKGMTMPQIVRDCEKVSGWTIPGETSFEVVRQVLQTLIDDKLVALGTKFVATVKGHEYLEDPFRWRIDQKTTEELADSMFWKEIHEIFDRAYRKLRSKT